MQNVSALSYVYLKDSGGNILEKINYDENKISKVLKLNVYCSLKKITEGATCFYFKDQDTSLNFGGGNKVLPVASQQNVTPSVQVPKALTNDTQPILKQVEEFPVANSAPQQNATSPNIVYQIIERAVPGPQGPAGRDGKDAATGNTEFLSQYATGAQYNGFGAGTGSSVNPTGDGNLSTIAGAGLSSCNLVTNKIVYNSTTKLFECATDQTGGSSFSGGNITGQVITATTSLISPVLFASTTYATTSNALNLVSSLATFTQATSTNLFANILTVLATTISNLLFTNATGTSATTTNLFSTNLSSTNSTLTNIEGTKATITSGTSTNWYSTNSNASNASFTNLLTTNATFTYATVTHGFFTNLQVTGPISAALTNGYTFRGSTGGVSEATSTIFVANNSFVGIGSTTPSEKFSVQGNMRVSGSIVSPNLSGLITSGFSDTVLCIDSTGNISKDTGGSCYTTASSDERLKSNIATVTSALEKVKGLNTVTFNWIDSSRGTSTQFGYIAQDILKVVPEVIKQDEKGFYKVNYQALSAIYANAIKELDERVTKLFTELADKILNVESRVENLEKRMSEVESRLQIQNSVNNLNTSSSSIPLWESGASSTGTTTTGTTTFLNLETLNGVSTTSTSTTSQGNSVVDTNLQISTTTVPQF